MTTYLDIDDLAELLGLRPNTIKRKLADAPMLVPPKMHILNSSMLRWRAHEVKNWMYEVDWDANNRRPTNR